MSNEPNDETLERVKDEIRAQAQALPQRRLLARQAPPERVRAQAASSIERNRLDYPIGELTDRHYLAFVDHAFRAILKRAPEPAEADSQIRLLAAGGGKAEVLGNLRYSPEGRRIGARISGLLPRYAMAKAGRVPVLGYLLQWGATLAGLPLLVRHQRASEALFAAGDEEARRAETALALRIDELAGDGAWLHQRIDDLHAFAHELNKARDAAMSALGEIEMALRGRIETLEAAAQAHAGRLDELAFLRQRVYAINHWSHDLNQAFARIEEVADRREAVNRALAGRSAMAALAADTQRDARNARWIDDLARQLPRHGVVMTFASGHDWFNSLLARGFEVCGDSSVEALPAGESAQASDHAAATPQGVLRRSDDASIDGLVVLAAASLACSMPMVEFLIEAARVLRPGGVILLAFSSEPIALVDALLGKVAPAISIELLEQALAAAGFGEISRVDAADGTPAVFARPAAP